MARKKDSARPARDRSHDDESVLIRSAESLGRMIGTLQRQLDIAMGQIAGSKPDGAAGKPAAAMAATKDGATRRSAVATTRGGVQAKARNSAPASARGSARKTSARVSAKKR
jgi:hypothetical protein